MNYKFYIIAIIAFTIIPITMSVLMLLPLLFPKISFIYFDLKPYGQQLFSDKQTMWTYISILSVGIGVILGFIYRDIKIHSKFKNTIKSYYEEILRNIDLIFSGEVERPFSFDIFNEINREYVSYIFNNEQYRRLRRIYDELYYYREMVKIWRVQNLGDIITERQFGVCNKILEYFNQGINPNMTDAELNKIVGGSRWQKLRTLAINQKIANKESWEEKLKQDIDNIFQVQL